MPTHGAQLPTPANLVERFYGEVWNRANEIAARQLLSPGFRFRGSLGSECQGPDEFIAYMRAVHAALGDYTCRIDDLIATQHRAAARMTFQGIHRGRFFDTEPTGREIRWAGAAFFRFEGTQIAELWVLGDIDAVKRQSNASASTRFHSQ